MQTSPKKEIRVTLILLLIVCSAGLGIKNSMQLHFPAAHHKDS